MFLHSTTHVPCVTHMPCKLQLVKWKQINQRLFLTQPTLRTSEPRAQLGASKGRRALSVAGTHGLSATKMSPLHSIMLFSKQLLPTGAAQVFNYTGWALWACCWLCLTQRRDVFVSANHLHQHWKHVAWQGPAPEPRQHDGGHHPQHNSQPTPSLAQRHLFTAWACSLTPGRPWGPFHDPREALGPSCKDSISEAPWTSGTWNLNTTEVEILL